VGTWVLDLGLTLGNMDEDFLVGGVFEGMSPVLLQKVSMTGRVTMCNQGLKYEIRGFSWYIFIATR